MSVRRILLLAAAACLLPATNRTPAQAPPADTEQRLRALEEKMDRLLKQVEGRHPAPPPALPEAAAAIDEARAKIRAQLAAKEEAYAKFRLQYPFFLVKNPAGTNTLMAERLAKYESKKVDFQIEREQKADQLARIEKAYKEGGAEKGNAQALRIMKIMGIKGDNANEAIETMKEEIDVLSTNMLALDNLIEAQTNEARKINEYEVREERIRSERDRLRKMLAGLDALLEESGKSPAK